MANENEDLNDGLPVVNEEEEEEGNALDYHQNRMPLPIFYDLVPEERSGHVAVAYGSYMYILGGYKNAAVQGYNDFYLPREELWIYNMETGRWKKKYTEGDVPKSMSGSCAACVDGVLYLFGGHHVRGNTNEFYILNLGAKDKVLHWEKIKDFKGVPPSPKDKLGCWVYKNKLIFFGGYGYQPREQYHGSFEFDESSFWNASHPRGWNNHVHFIDLETFTWYQPITKGKPPSPRAAHACATIGNRGYVFGGRYQDARTNDLYYLDLDTWEWNEVVQSPDQIPVGRSWHSLTTISNDHLFLFGGFTTDKQPLSDAWIYSVSTNEWLKVEHQYSDKPRLWHSACTSDEAEVIVFGGCANNLLAHQQAAHSNDILIFSVQPKSLVRLPLSAIVTSPSP
ncbi:kelch domain-containing protein 2-like isoform X2 [Chiloscyllium plagiosum]|uniref:kelch domain-containing protein 2-like isoform X2 n=1 Tax=Chiloscyllium plagiosum TaxID=36176 RepID=UPI001CB7E85D|nr:kelch domain-containing protein 2-like isoform X2 [Chiloscyllium plagiosum]